MEAMPPRDRDLEQRIMDIDGQDVTGSFVQAARDDFARALAAAFTQLAADAFTGRTATGAILEACLEAQRQYFNSLKGGVNFSEDDTRALVACEAARQRAFHEGLQKLARSFAGAGVHFEVLPPGGVYAEVGWRADFIFGTFIRTDNTACLYAAPPATWTTTDYLSATQNPVAAGVLAAAPAYVLFLPADQDPGEEFFSACRAVLGDCRNVTAEVPGTHRAGIVPGCLVIDSDATYEAAEIDDFRVRFNVTAVLTGNTGDDTATLHLPEPPEYRRLFTELGLA